MLSLKQQAQAVVGSPIWVPGVGLDASKWQTGLESSGLFGPEEDCSSPRIPARHFHARDAWSSMEVQHGSPMRMSQVTAPNGSSTHDCCMQDV